MNEPNLRDRTVDAFLVLGSQYYATGRYLASQHYLPVCSTLLHRAIEMLLKGYLSKNIQLSELKKIGHNLESLWELFKTESGHRAASDQDSTVAQLNHLSLLRYPDVMVTDGFKLNIRFGPTSPIRLPGTELLPSFGVDVHVIDAIVEAIFTSCAKPAHAYFVDAPTELANSLPHRLRALE